MKVRILFALAALSAAVAPSQLLAAPRGLYLGADLSYVYEMEDCGAVYRLKGKPIDLQHQSMRGTAGLAHVASDHPAPVVTDRL